MNALRRIRKVFHMRLSPLAGKLASGSFRLSAENHADFAATGSIRHSLRIAIRFQRSSIQSGKNAHKSALREHDRDALISPPVLGATPGFARPRTIHLQRTPALLPVGGGFNSCESAKPHPWKLRFWLFPDSEEGDFVPAG